MLNGRHPMPIFLFMVSTVWKDDRRSDKSYSREKSGKFRKSTTVKFDGNYPRRFLQFGKTTGGRISPIAARKVENLRNRHYMMHMVVLSEFRDLNFAQDSQDETR
ncbi:hypothetical protein Tco_0696874 [Tanacetum coccineum]